MKNDIHRLLREAETTVGNVNSANKIALAAEKDASKNPRDPGLQRLANQTAMSAKNAQRQQTIEANRKSRKDAIDGYSGKKEEERPFLEASEVLLHAIDEAVEERKAALERSKAQKKEAIERIEEVEKKHDESIETRKENIQRQIDLIDRQKAALGGDEHEAEEVMAEAALSDPKKDAEDIKLSTAQAGAEADNLSDDEKKDK